MNRAIRAGKPKVHTGVCDASAAVFVEPGKTLFLVADDEDQQQTILRLYDAAADGPPLRESHLSKAALKPDPDEPEIDLEGSAWLGERIFWIGSHSRSKKGKPRPSRHRLFATSMSKGEPQVVGRPYSTLVKDLSRLVKFDVDPELPPKLGGLSIEGLSSTPVAGELLIGLRSPLVDGCAVLIPLENADAVVDRGARARFGEPVLLDLHGFGIRSIDYWPERHTYLLLAGPAGDGKGDIRLMRWSGPISGTPEPLDVDFDELGIGEGASAEALLIESASETVYLLFDEGNRKVNGGKCKDSDHKSFRSVAVHGL